MFCLIVRTLVLLVAFWLSTSLMSAVSRLSATKVTA